MARCQEIVERGVKEQTRAELGVGEMEGAKALVGLDESVVGLALAKAQQFLPVGDCKTNHVKGTRVACCEAGATK